MSTNYYRIPTYENMLIKQRLLIKQVLIMDMSAENIASGMKCISPIKDGERFSPWDVFIDDTNIHLGKRSSGWKFCWNFNNKEYYYDKNSLLKFIRSGRIVNEYGEQLNVEEFITMALEWEEPDGLIVDEKYNREERLNGGYLFLDNPKYYDKIIDGLRVSSSTDFC